MDWGPRLKREEKTSVAPAFISSGFPMWTQSGRRPHAPVATHALCTMMNSTFKLSHKNPSSSSFCQSGENTGEYRRTEETSLLMTWGGHWAGSCPLRLVQQPGISRFPSETKNENANQEATQQLFCAPLERNLMNMYGIFSPWNVRGRVCHWSQKVRIHCGLVNLCAWRTQPLGNWVAG